jgi:ubiquinone/menaquinone biosynthesis C-methylase UbiE
MKEILLHPSDHKNEKDWKIILNFLDENLDYSKISKSLELGAGMGNISFHILNKNPKSQAVCEDINPEYLKIISKRNPRIETICHDINQPLPFKENNFDLVSCIGTLHYSYVRDLNGVLKEMVRVSNKYLLVDFFSANSLFAFLERIRYPKYNPRRFTYPEIQKNLKS